MKQGDNNFTSMLTAVKKNFSANCSVKTVNSYATQNNSTTVEMLDDRHALFLDESFHPETGERYAFISWLVTYNEPIQTGSTFDLFSHGFENNPNIQTIVQTRGERNCGFQVCAIGTSEQNQSLHTVVEYLADLESDTTKKQKDTDESSVIPTGNIIDSISSGDFESLFNKNKNIGTM